MGVQKQASRVWVQSNLPESVEQPARQHGAAPPLNFTCADHEMHYLPGTCVLKEIYKEFNNRSSQLVEGVYLTILDW